MAGGTSAVGQRVLEALLGDQAVRTLAAKRAARTCCGDARTLLDAERSATRCSCPARRPGPAGLERLEAAVDALERAR